MREEVRWAIAASGEYLRASFVESRFTCDGCDIDQDRANVAGRVQNKGGERSFVVCQACVGDVRQSGDMESALRDNLRVWLALQMRVLSATGVGGKLRFAMCRLETTFDFDPDTSVLRIYEDGPGMAGRHLYETVTLPPLTTAQTLALNVLVGDPATLPQALADYMIDMGHEYAQACYEKGKADGAKEERERMKKYMDARARHLESIGVRRRPTSQPTVTPGQFAALLAAAANRPPVPPPAHDTTGGKTDE